MESKQKILERLGKKDGFDERRWEIACDMAQELDIHVNFCFESLLRLEEKGFIQFNVITLEDCVNECYKNNEFVKEFNRLNNSNLKCSNSFYTQIDIATGKTKDDLKKFVEVVDLTIYQPLLTQQDMQ